MVLLQLILVVLVQTTFALNKEYYDVNSMENVNALFEEFLQKHNKHYEGNETVKRLNIFRETLEEINRLNAEHPHTSFGITFFADLTADEMEDYQGFRPSEVFGDGVCSNQGDPRTRDAPSSHDWRNSGAVTSVKNQQTCGSCWAFSATATIESRYAMKTGQQVDLSEQQLVDCDHRSNGCQGGWPTSAFTKLIEDGGHEQETAYPYRNAAGTCRFDRRKVAVRVASCSMIKVTSEDSLKEVLFKEGPVSIAIDSSPLEGILHYNGGIFTACRFAQLNHAVQLVGYGSENGLDYWIIKNSYGPSWGESGYMRIRRGVNCLGVLNGGAASAKLA